MTNANWCEELRAWNLFYLLDIRSVCYCFGIYQETYTDAVRCVCVWVCKRTLEPICVLTWLNLLHIASIYITCDSLKRECQSRTHFLISCPPPPPPPRSLVDATDTAHTHMQCRTKTNWEKKRSNENKFVLFAFDLSHSLRVLRNSSETILLHFVLNKYIQMWWFRFLLNQLQLHFHTVRLFTSDRWNVHTRHNNCLVFRYVDFETNVSKHSAVHIHSLVIFKEKFNTIDNINNKLQSNAIVKVKN